ncbi:MAG: ABC transporter permease [Streptococcaceae bacterium]|jgi:putative ABC transport system permease protein|nr:ABC transporter permease [Streptococcaceae bacterium]
MYLAWKEIRYSKLRYGLIIGIMTLVAYVVFMLSGLAAGLSAGHSQAIVDWQASQFVLSEDSNKIASASQLKVKDIARVDAHEKAGIGFYSSSITKKGSSDKTNVSIFGTEKNSFILPKLVSGRLYSKSNEIVVSENLTGYKIGDKVEIGDDQSFTIVGISPKTTYSMTAVIYLNLDAFAKLKYGENAPSDEADRPINIIALKKAAHKISTSSTDTKLEELSSKTLIENLPGYTPEKLTLNAMIYFLFVVVTAIVGIFMYVMTLQKISIFGVLKAQGISSGTLMRSILGQALIVSAAGSIIAMLLSGLTSLVLPAAMPFSVQWPLWTVYAVVVVLVSMLGGVFSLHTITKVDPVTAIGGE